MDFKYSRVFLSCLLITAANNLNALQALNTHQCELISSYESREESPFSEHFANMVHRRELCMENSAECAVPLQKRIEDYYLVVKGEKHFATDEMLQVSRDALANVISQMEAMTRIKARLEKPTGTENFIHLVYVDTELATRRYSDYTAGWIVPDSMYEKNPEGKEIARKMFQLVLEGAQPCIVLSQYYPDSVISGAQIWINIANDEELMRRCIAEEIFNSMGLSEGTEVTNIFDYPFSHNDSDTELSEFDLLMMKLLYRRELKAGSTRLQTIERVSGIIANECPAAYQTPDKSNDKEDRS